MNGKKVTESALELMTMANGDIKNIESRLQNKHGFENIDNEENELPEIETIEVPVFKRVLFQFKKPSLSEILCN